MKLWCKPEKGLAGYKNRFGGSQISDFKDLGRNKSRLIVEEGFL